MEGKLALSMIFTLAAIIGISTLAFAFILDYLGLFDITTLAVLVIGFNVFQWLIGPYVINMLYNVKEADPVEHAELYYIVKRLSAKAGLPTPKLMIANMPIPNAFAYGSPLTGNMVAVTQGLLDVLDEEEIEAVIGHELGHLKHRDVQVMMLVSMIPSIFYIIARSALFYSGRREREGGSAIIIGLASLFVYWILTLLTLHLSRLREYYADEFSVQLAPSIRDGARRLAEALAKIVLSTAKMSSMGIAPKVPGFKALLIADPDSAVRDAVELTSHGDWRLVERVASREVTLADQLMELLSTHPNVVKRIRRLLRMAE